MVINWVGDMDGPQIIIYNIIHESITLPLSQRRVVPSFMKINCFHSSNSACNLMGFHYAEALTSAQGCCCRQGLTFSFVCVLCSLLAHAGKVGLGHRSTHSHVPDWLAVTADANACFQIQHIPTGLCHSHEQFQSKKLARLCHNETVCQIGEPVFR